MIGFGPLDQPFTVLAGKIAGEHVHTIEVIRAMGDAFRITREIVILLRWHDVREVGTGIYEVINIPWQNRERKTCTPAQ